MKPGPNSEKCERLKKYNKFLFSFILASSMLFDRADTGINYLYIAALQAFYLFNISRTMVHIVIIGVSQRSSIIKLYFLSAFLLTTFCYVFSWS